MTDIVSLPEDIAGLIELLDQAVKFVPGKGKSFVGEAIVKAIAALRAQAQEVERAGETNDQLRTRIAELENAKPLPEEIAELIDDVNFWARKAEGQSVRYALQKAAAALRAHAQEVERLTKAPLPKEIAGLLEWATKAITIPPGQKGYPGTIGLIEKLAAALRAQAQEVERRRVNEMALGAAVQRRQDRINQFEDNAAALKEWREIADRRGIELGEMEEERQKLRARIAELEAERDTIRAKTIGDVLAAIRDFVPEEAVSDAGNIIRDTCLDLIEIIASSQDSDPCQA